MESEGEGSMAKFVKGPVQLSDSFALITLASLPDLAPWRMAEAML